MVFEGIRNCVCVQGFFRSSLVEASRIVTLSLWLAAFIEASLLLSRGNLLVLLGRTWPSTGCSVFSLTTSPSVASIMTTRAMHAAVHATTMGARPLWWGNSAQVSIRALRGKLHGIVFLNVDEECFNNIWKIRYGVTSSRGRGTDRREEGRADTRALCHISLELSTMVRASGDAPQKVGLFPMCGFFGR